MADRPSPNHGPRPAGRAIDILLLHYTGMTSAEGSLQWLCHPRSKVSCHYFVFEDGRVVRLVPEDRRAWHAGVSFWAGETDINSRSIGIEIANPGHEFGYPDFPPVQIEAVIALCRGILQRHPIPPGRVLGHSDVALERKRDPGEKFPWRQLAESGIGRWIEPAPIVDEPGTALTVGRFGREVADLQGNLRDYGYRITPTGAFDWQTELVVFAFQRHFRPQRVDGRADASTRTTLTRLLAARGGHRV